MLRVALASLAFVAVLPSAHADQCQSVSADHAAWATKLLTKNAVVATFCESCGDTKPGTPTTITSITTKASTAKDLKTVQINGKAIDLAYTYLQTGKSTWANVGLLVGCPVSGGTAIYTTTPEAKSSPATPLAKTGVPECDDYFRILDELAQCPKFPPEALKAMRDASAEVRKTIGNMPVNQRGAIAGGCKAGADAMKQAAGSMGCTIK